MESGEVRLLTRGERDLASSVFGSAIVCDAVTVKRRRWFPFQPRNTFMAPTGHLHISPASDHWSEDFSCERLSLQGLFVHELTHVWQSQVRGKYYLPLMRHPFCRYDYRLEPGRPFDRYGLEQQAEIVRHFFLLTQGASVPGAPPFECLGTILPFGAA